MKKVLLLLANGFETFEASVFIDVLGWNRTDGDGSTELITCGREKEVISSFNIRVTTDLTIRDVRVDEFDALAIPGGFEAYGFFHDAYRDEFLALIREFDRKNRIIASICVGALPVGKSGVLRGRKATTYNLDGGKRQTELRECGADVVQEPIVTDGNIITSWNPSTAPGVAFILLERLTSRKNTDCIRTLMGFRR
jgi:4-methyl-5(b-hydroxyethyl)-thiazole monophosphate biosynthesis